MQLGMGKGMFEKVAVVGTGVMGQGIAEVMCLAGSTVLLHDAREGAAASAVARIGDSLQRRVARGRISAEDRETALARLHPVSSLSELADASLVVEAIVEDLDAKRSLMRELEAVVAPDCILASNTSSLSVTEIAAACAHPRRVAGYHFFNPVPAMKVVEIVAGARTDAAVADALVAFARRFGHHPIVAADSPGFIVNHAGRGYGTEAFRLLAEQVAPFHVIDRIMREAAGFRMGPFELLDLTGLDVSHPVMESIYHQFYQEPRFRPSPIARRRAAAGLYGRKSGGGFYDYVEGKPVLPDVSREPVALEPAALPSAVRILPGEGEEEVRKIARLAGVALADDAELALVPLIGEDATTAVCRLGLFPDRTLGFDPLFGLNTHRTLVATPATTVLSRARAQALFTADGIPASVVEDSYGAVAQRIVATIVNIASDIAQQGIATPADIDAGVRLGLNYPYGPLEWGDRIGPALILRILETQFEITRDPRYRPSLWLRRRAMLGLPLAG